MTTRTLVNILHAVFPITNHSNMGHTQFYKKPHASQLCVCCRYFSIRLTIEIKLCLCQLLKERCQFISDLNNIGKITKCMSVNYYICSRNTHFSRLCWSSGIKARLISFSLSSALCPLCQHLVPFAILGVSAGIKAMAVQ